MGPLEWWGCEGDPRCGTRRIAVTDTPAENVSVAVVWIPMATTNTLGHDLAEGRGRGR